MKGVLPIRLVGTIVRGYGRGSAELGIPTANLSRECLMSSSVSFDCLPCGIYWGFARVVNSLRIHRDGSGSETENAKGDADAEGITYKAAISIGYNPHYGNEEKTVEPHLIASPDHPDRRASCCGETILGDFYGRTLRLSVVGHLRAERPFEGLEQLTLAIKKDIVDAEVHADATDEVTMREKTWVGSSSEPNEDEDDEEGRMHRGPSAAC